MEATTSIFGIDNAMLTIFATDILRPGAYGFRLVQSARGLGVVIGSSILSAQSDAWHEPRNGLRFRFPNLINRIVRHIQGRCRVCRKWCDTRSHTVKQATMIEVLMKNPLASIFSPAPWRGFYRSACRYPAAVVSARRDHDDRALPPLPRSEQ